jgi:molybdate transport system permease protein
VSGARRGASPIPPALALAALLGALFFAVPLAGLVVRTPWSETAAVLRSPAVRTALGISLAVSLAATALAVAIGLPLAWLLARGRFRGRGALRTLVMMPMVLPPVVAGVALLAAFGRRGLVGGALAAAGFSIALTPLAAVLAAAFVATPLLVSTLEAGLLALDPHYEHAAHTLGASPWRVLRAVVLPAVRHSLVAGIALAWARALGEFGATITFAGSLPGRTQTLTLLVYETLQTRPEHAFLLGCALLAVSAAVLALVGTRGRVT